MQLRVEDSPRSLARPSNDGRRPGHAALARLSHALAGTRGSVGDFIAELCVRAEPVLGRGLGIAGCILSIEGDVCRVEKPVFVGCPRTAHEAMCSASLAIAAAEARAALFEGPAAATASERLAPTRHEYLARRELAHLARAGIVDHLFLRLSVGPSVGSRAVFLFVPCGRPLALKSRERAALVALAAELGSAIRLRAMLNGVEARPSPTQNAPVFGVDGERLEVEGALGEGRAKLLASAIPEPCRAAGEAPDPVRARALWHELVAGRWSAVAHTDSGGKRVLLARRSDSGGRTWPRLSEREKYAARSVLDGRSNKLIGYDLGISPASATVFVDSAIRKLGLRSRAELARAFRTAPANAR